MEILVAKNAQQVGMAQIMDYKHAQKCVHLDTIVPVDQHMTKFKSVAKG
jgi:hypothetical protein